jgi:hypothetical protein
MSKSFLDEALKERTRLQAEMEASELWQRMQLLDQVIASYGGPAAGKLRAMSGQAKPNDRAKAKQGGFPTKEEEIIQLAMACIKANDGYAPKRAIHQYIAMHDVDVSDAALSAYLSKASGLTFDRERGWSINEYQRSAEIVSLSAASVGGMTRPVAPAEPSPVNPQDLWAADKIF